MPDEGGENRIYQFLSFSVYFWKFWLRQGGLSFYGSQKGDEGADTDLMFQFCLPYSPPTDIQQNINQIVHSAKTAKGEIQSIDTQTLLHKLKYQHTALMTEKWANQN